MFSKAMILVVCLATMAALVQGQAQIPVPGQPSGSSVPACENYCSDFIGVVLRVCLNLKLSLILGALPGILLIITGTLAAALAALCTLLAGLSAALRVNICVGTVRLCAEGLNLIIRLLLGGCGSCGSLATTYRSKCIQYMTGLSVNINIKVAIKGICNIIINIMISLGVSISVIP